MKKSIRFEDILPGTGGQDDAFEELSCQLARRHRPDAALEFRRIRGAGGDGGIEGYWLLADGGKVGYQAKFFKRSREVRWNQIDASVGTALKLHPELRRYVVAIACDLTDKTARGGVAGWQNWETHRLKWEAQADRALGRKVSFEIWTASDLREMLDHPAMAGLRAHWFGELALTPAWFADRAGKAMADLDERYHAEDHVQVDAERLFDFLLRNHRALSVLRERFARVRDLANQHLVQPEDASGMHGAQVVLANQQVAEVLTLATSLDAPSWVPWNAALWVSRTKSAIRSVNDVWHAIRSAAADGGEMPGREVDLRRDGLMHLVRELDALGNTWADAIARAEGERAVLLTGRSGTGKSHLMAVQAESAIAEGRPVVLVLGQYLRAGPIWPQILGILGMDGSAERFLQALDASAEALGTRALFLVDALNEGAGAHLWRAEIASFVKAFRPFANVVCVLSCRSEYLPYVMPRSVAHKIPHREVRGFQTPQEHENAARVYMDRKGIVRPSTPWLGEEFTNPLFLRSVCLALQRDGKHEFPRGLVGIKKILAFYLESVARHLTPDYEGSQDLLSPTRATLLAIAHRMAQRRSDHVTRDDADAIARSAFTSFVQPPNQTWLEVLQRSGLVRFDPDPGLAPDGDDPLPPSIELVRFSFQRFQDHLTAEALLKNVVHINAAFDAGGPLHHLLDARRWDGTGAGLIGALAIQIPERWGQELIDVMPGGARHWTSNWAMERAFEDSLRLRGPHAFTARTAELLERWIAPGGQSLSLLIELATIADHPWNAEAMHARLIATPMPERDVRWSLALSDVKHDDEQHALNALLAWCASVTARTALPRSRELAALAVAWCLTSTNRPVRDTATKGLTRLMLIQQDLLTYLLVKFARVDDVYVLERLWAAAFGACTHDPTPARLQTYAAAAWESVFASTPPKDLLLRDYARAVIELAVHWGAKLEGINVARCRPPYLDATIDFDKVTELDSKDESHLGWGAQRILSSCGPYGDFGSYEIRPVVAKITTLPLTALPVQDKASAFRHFRETVLAERLERIAAFHEISEYYRAMSMPQFLNRRKGLAFKSKKPTKRELARAQELCARFENSLTPAEAESFREHAIPWLTDSSVEQAECIDLGRCRAWVARRAIELGGGALDVEGGGSGSVHQRPAVERLGKKYQWIALGELLCGLTSTRCLESGWQEDRRLHAYDYPTDLGFVRDIDPTVLAHCREPAASGCDAWMFGEPISLPPVTENELAAWPARQDPGAEMHRQVVRTDVRGHRWFVLHEHAHKSEESRRAGAHHGTRQQAFRRMFSVFVESSRLKAFKAELERHKKVDVSQWEVPQLTDGPFLGEIFWRATYPLAQWSEQVMWMPPTTRVAFPIVQYVWESHLDLGLADGARAYLPAPWLAGELGMTILPFAGDAFPDASGEEVLVRKAAKDRDVVLISEAALRRLAQRGLHCIWLLVAERNAWPSGTSHAAIWRRAEGFAWEEGDHVASRTWKHDGSTQASVSRKRAGRRAT